MIALVFDLNGAQIVMYDFEGFRRGEDDVDDGSSLTRYHLFIEDEGKVEFVLWVVFHPTAGQEAFDSRRDHFNDLILLLAITDGWIACRSLVANCQVVHRGEQSAVVKGLSR